jgi:hypothetical protein
MEFTIFVPYVAEQLLFHSFCYNTLMEDIKCPFIKPFFNLA